MVPNIQGLKLKLNTRSKNATVMKSSAAANMDVDDDVDVSSKMGRDIVPVSAVAATTKGVTPMPPPSRLITSKLLLIIIGSAGVKFQTNTFEF